ncbi:MAG TPA: RHS repeat-associated core domain-containing protein [Anaerohalosphaeraceae bacterium]|nr:RHS repeat-associated core domain-containing protein [Anaerohalosphaeraceae bacterium]HRT24801.1 RHS repeat-associated core domain-containing protein [Anaerohalosphaeraceae bacterium]
MKKKRFTEEQIVRMLRTAISGGGTESDGRMFVFGNYLDEVLVSVIPAQAPNQDLYYAHDHLYSPVALFAANGTVAERYEYNAYGKVQVLSSDFLVLSSSRHGNPYAFTGRELDTLDADSLHLMYYRTRTYDPETGRFMQRHPLMYVDGANIYEYVLSNPAIDIDPLGLRREERDRRRDRRRDWGRRRGFNFDLFDDKGRIILDHWLNGSGDELVFNDGDWGEYMMNNQLLSPVLCTRLQDDVLSRTASGTINQTFQAIIENGYLTGYEMLHGTNEWVGGFNITGSATVIKDSTGCCNIIDYSLTYTWNDIIDPEPDTYPGDTILSWILHLFYDPADYTIRISWTQNAKAKVCNGAIYRFEG